MTEPKPEYRDSERLDLPSASAMERTVACPGSVNLIRSLPPEAFNQKPEEEDEWAKKGTRIHAAFETGNTLDLDAEEADIYRQGVEYEKSIVDKWVYDKALEGFEEGPREMRVWLHDPLNFPDLLGSVKIDRHYIGLPRSRGCVCVTDLKSGWNPNLPQSPRSWQLRFAAVALWKEEYGDWMKEARVGYCKAQQKCTVNDFCNYAEQDLIYSWQSIQFHLWESSQPDAPRHPGQHCNWCPAKAWCPETGGLAMLPSVIARSVPESNLMPWNMMVDQMQPVDCLKIWDNHTIIEKILKAVTLRLKKMPKEQLTDLGLDLGKGREIKTVGNMALAFQLMCSHFSESDVVACTDFVKERLIALVMRERGHSKEEAQKWVEVQLAPFTSVTTADAPLKRIRGI